MGLQIYNTLSRKKENFKSLEPGKVKMYVCGPTVYDYLHVGNFFGAIFFNLVRNWLEKEHAYDVEYVYNYTDVDDKIIAKSIEEGSTASEISEKYISEFEKDYKALSLKSHSKNPRVTEYMTQIVDFIAGLIKKEKAYELNGDVYFHVPSFSEYGKLSNKNINELLSGQRVDINDQKKHMADFALWKKAKPGEPSWESPWSQGRPGWHIECSVMNHSIHGDQIDIHGGGLDLTFPHHENEICQTEAFTGKNFANYWMHNNMLQLGQAKMSKSLGNILTGRAFLEEYNGEILKFLILSSHYRSVVDFSEKQIHRTMASLGKFYSSFSHAKKIINNNTSLAPVPEKFERALEKAEVVYKKSMDDDFNTPQVIAEFYELMRLYNQICRSPGKIRPEQAAVAESYYHWLRSHADIMALFQEDPESFLIQLDDMLLKKKGLQREAVDALVKERSEARDQKNYAKSDELRNKLVNMGIALQDSAESTSWEVDKS